MKTLILGDCLEEMKCLPENSIDAIVTDPPYGLEFMGNDWDGANGFRRSLNSNDVNRESVFGRTSRTSPEYKTGSAFQEWCQAWAIEGLRVLKPGGHMLAFGGSRTYHRMACAIEDAGFEIRDQIMWLYGQGFPKSHNLGNGWGTALKPAHEPIVLARKPLIATVAKNVERYQTGALNIEGCRAGSRWPANIMHDGSDEVIDAFPDAPQQGDLKNHANDRQSPNGIFGKWAPAKDHAARFETEKSAARFFYCAKTSKKERGEGNAHPTVKPVALMRYLCRLVTPLNGTTLDPFMGSGSTGKAALLEGFNFIGIEKNPEYFAIAEKRICKLK